MSSFPPPCEMNVVLAVLISGWGQGRKVNYTTDGDFSIHAINYMIKNHIIEDHTVRDTNNRIKCINLSFCTNSRTGIYDNFHSPITPCGMFLYDKKLKTRSYKDRVGHSGVSIASNEMEGFEGRQYEGGNDSGYLELGRTIYPSPQ